MTGPEHYRRAELLVAEAYKHLGLEDEQVATDWATVAQVHATLALAAATALGGGFPTTQAWRDATGVRHAGPE